MTQKRYWNWKDDDSTMDLSNWMKHLFPHGVYYGFDADFAASTGTGMQFVLKHSVTGTNYVDEGLTNHTNLGVLMTKQGVVIREDASISLPISPGNATFGRIDTIIVEHEFQEVVGGSPALYAVIEGTPAAIPVAAALTAPSKQTIIGYLFIPAGTTNISLTPAVTWTLQPITNSVNDATVMRTDKVQTSTAEKTFSSLRGILKEAVLGPFSQLELSEPSNFYVFNYVAPFRYQISNILANDKNGAWFSIFTKQKLALKGTSTGGVFYGSSGTGVAGGQDIYIEAGESFTLINTGDSLGTGNDIYHVLKGGELSKTSGPKLTSMLRENKGLDAAVGSNGELSLEILLNGGNFFEIVGGTTTLRQILSMSTYDNGGTVGEENNTGGTVIRLINASTSAITVQHNLSLPIAKYKRIISPTGASFTFEIGAILEIIEDETGWRILNYTSVTKNPFAHFLDDNLDVTITGPLFPGNVLYYDGTQWVNSSLETLITNTERTFTKAQSLGVVSAGASTVNVATGVVTLNGNGNNYELNFPAGNVDITDFVKTVGTFPPGTVLNLTFVGAAGSGIRRLSTGPSGTNIQSYRSGNGADLILFDFNDTLQVVRLTSGKWYIISITGHLVRRLDTDSNNITSLLSYNPSSVITKVVDIGAWDMTTANQKNVNHGVADFGKIISISVMLMNDMGSLSLPLLSGAVNVTGFNNDKVRGSAQIFSTYIQLVRTANADGGDTSVNAGLTVFQSTGVSRGKILIQYLP